MRATTGWILCALSLVAGCGGGDSKPSVVAPPPTYSVGGSVSGLTGTVTLANNGSDARTLSANGAFTFPTALANGAAYAVTVTTQPANQTCTVTGGSGAVAAANVSAVTVNCVTNTVTIGGNVTGLGSAGLVLQNNGGDNLAIPANGAFTFATHIDSGTGYNVTVLTQPAGHTCSAGLNTGTATANVTTVSISCTTNVYAVGGVINGLRNVTLSNNGSNQRFFSDGPFAFTQGTPYGSPYNVTVVTSGTTCTVSNGTGTVTGAVTNVIVDCPSVPVISQQPVSQTVEAPAAATFSAIITGFPAPTFQWQRSIDAGATWNDIPGATSATYTTPPTSLDDAGIRFRIVAVNSAGTVRSSVTSLGVTWPATGRIWRSSAVVSEATGPFYAAVDHQVAMNARGDGIVVWQKADAGGNTIWANTYTTAGGWAGATLIGSNPGVQATHPRVAIAANGNAVVVWEATTVFNPAPLNRRRDVRSNYFTPGGGWSGNVLVEQNDGASPFWLDSMDARVTISDTGVALVVWTQYDQFDTTNNSVLYATGSSGNWSTSNVVAGGNATLPALAGSGDGSAVAAWIQSTASGLHINASRFTGATWTPPETIDHDAQDASSPAVAINATGEAVAVWQIRGAQKVMGARTASQAWQPDVRISASTDAVSSAVDLFPQISANGNVIVRWNSSVARVLYGTWLNGQELLSPASGTQLDLARNSLSQVLAVWQGAQAPFAARADGDYVLGIGSSATLTTNSADQPHIALSEDGTAISIWVESDGNANRVWASVFR